MMEEVINICNGIKLRSVKIKWDQMTEAIKFNTGTRSTKLRDELFVPIVYSTGDHNSALFAYEKRIEQCIYVWIMSSRHLFVYGSR